MKAVILAGGKGTRLGDYTRDVPKPMIPIGKKPLLHHQVDLLVRYNIREIIILVNYLKDPIIEYFGNGHLFNAQITYFEEPSPLGTTGGIKEIEDQLEGDFLVLYGDVMVNMDLSRLIGFHKTKNSDCTLVLHPNDHPYDSDLVETDDTDQILAFHSKPHPGGMWYHNMVNAGLYVLSPKIFKFLEKGIKADFGKNIFPIMLGKTNMFGYHTSEYLKDMGTPDRLLIVNHDLESGRIINSNYEFLQRAIFLDRDGVINTERSFISKPEELEIYDYTPAAIRKINQSGYLSVVVTNQSAVARNLCTEKDVQTIHKKLETLLGEQKAWLDAIYYCPHHPDKGFPEENPQYKIACDCRKPGIGMFKKAIEKFNINPAISFMIGDSERDIQAGINAGCITMGVRTGYGIKKTKVLPDFMFENLAEAVDYIVEDPHKNTAAKVMQAFNAHNIKTPWIVSVGGLPRSGKSTLAAYLRHVFIGQGYRVMQISLDNWIIPEEFRAEGMNVYDRFQLSVLEKDVQKIIKGQQVEVKTYANHHERKSFPVIYNPENIDVIIMDGIIAMSSANLRDAAHLKIFMQIDHELFHKRMHAYYSWRGKTGDEIDHLIKKREVDEYQLIEKESKLADLIINATGS